MRLTVTKGWLAALIAASAIVTFAPASNLPSTGRDQPLVIAAWTLALATGLTFLRKRNSDF